MRFTWRKLNTVRTSYVSSFPANVWLIQAAGTGWQLRRAVEDFDQYEAVGKPHKTLAMAKKAAEDWSPTE